MGGIRGAGNIVLDVVEYSKYSLVIYDTDR